MNEIGKGIITATLGLALTAGFAGSTAGFVDCVIDTNKLLDQKEGIIDTYLEQHKEIDDKYAQHCVNTDDFSFIKEDETRTKVENVNADLQEQENYALFAGVGMAFCGSMSAECFSKARDSFSGSGSTSIKEDELSQ